MKTGLIMEGGAMRGMFTCGVLDVMMEHQIPIDGAIGVSAGAVFGCNYKSNQPGRALRYNTKYCNDPRYASIRSLLKTGDLYGEEFCYHMIPETLDPFDTQTFQNSPMEFYVVCSDVNTGKAVYHQCKKGDANDLQWMRASASMPLVSKIVTINGYSLLDGGICDSIPIRYFEYMGYKHNIIILTQPKGYVKKQIPYFPIIKILLRRYPRFISAIAHRPHKYNRTTAYIEKREAEGQALVIRPPKALDIGHVEHNPEELKRVYEIGRQTALERLEEILQFTQTQ